MLTVRTKIQYKKAAKIAARVGEVDIDGAKLICHDAYDWEVVDVNGNTVDTAAHWETLAYLFIPGMMKYENLYR